MNAYFQWVLRQFYLLYFWPRRLVHESNLSRWSSALRQFTFPPSFTLEDEAFLHSKLLRDFRTRLRYLARMLPWIVLLCVCADLLFGLVWEMIAGPYKWTRSLLWMAVGMAFGASLGLVLNVAISLTLSVLFGVLLGWATGLPFIVRIGAPDEFLMIFVFALFAWTIGSGFSILRHTGIEYLSDLKYEIKRAIPLSLVLAVANGVHHALRYDLTSGVIVAVGLACGLPIGYFRLPDFFLCMVWASTCHNRLRRNASEATVWWRRYPLAWNEVIWLPLPRAGEFLSLLVRHNRNLGFEKIAFVAAERPLQGRAAKVALIEVALDDLSANSLRKLADLPARLEWTRGEDVDLPEEIREALPAFVRVGELVAQGQSLQSRYRQKDALEKARQELENLRKRLISGAHQLNPRLLQRANAWAELLKTEIDRVAAVAKAEGEIYQAFRFGNPVREDEAFVFAGRKDVISELESVLLADAHPPAILLHGPRRMGKSSILCQLPRLLGPDFAPVNLDWQNSAVRSSAAHLFAAVTRELSLALKRKTVCIEPLERAALQTDAFGGFDDWLRGTEKAMPGQLRAVICFDEYEALNEALAAGWDADVSRNGP